MIDDYGEKKALEIIDEIILQVDNVGMFPQMGIKLNEKFGKNLPDDLYILIVERNYILYKLSDEIHILNIYNEKEDIIGILFGLSINNGYAIDSWEDEE